MHPKNILLSSLLVAAVIAENHFNEIANMSAGLQFSGNSNLEPSNKSPEKGFLRGNYPEDGRRSFAESKEREGDREGDINNETEEVTPRDGESVNIEVDFVNKSVITEKDGAEFEVRRAEIIGGRTSSFGNNPWQAQLINRYGVHGCGGVLLNNRWVLTAAHCVHGKLTWDVIVRLGEYDVTTQSEPLPHQDYGVKRFATYQGEYPSGFRGDLSLLNLDRVVSYYQHIRPIELPELDLNLDNRQATVTGWGHLGLSSNYLGSAVLQEAHVQIIPNEICEKLFLQSGHRAVIDDAFLCAGRIDEDAGSCWGDSGGPLTTLVNGRRVLVGIVSWGYKDCSRRGSPDLFTNVRKYLPWIKNIIRY